MLLRQKEAAQKSTGSDSDFHLSDRSWLGYLFTPPLCTGLVKYALCGLAFALFSFGINFRSAHGSDLDFHLSDRSWFGYLFIHHLCAGLVRYA